MPFPYLEWAFEETPEDEKVEEDGDPVVEHKIFGTRKIKLPERPVGVDVILPGSLRTNTKCMAIPRSLVLQMPPIPRPQDVGILAVEVYLPRRVSDVHPSFTAFS